MAKLTRKHKNRGPKIHLHFNNWKSFLVFIIIIAVLGALAYYMGWLDILLKDEDDDTETLSTAGGYTKVVDEFEDLQINFLQVGQADCIVIELPDNRTMMIDTGDSTSDRTVIANFLSDNDITYIDYLLITHSDSDHVGNADWVLETYEVKYIFRPKVYSDNEISADIPSSFNSESTNEDTFVCDKDIYAKFIVNAYNEGCTVEYFNKDSDFYNIIKCGEETRVYNFNFLTPTASKDNISYEEANNFSPIMLLEYCGKKVMFNGDAELEVLEEYCQEYSDTYNVDVLKVGHHGSNNATTEEYISAIDPEFAVIQNGWNKNYRHPHQETLDILTNHEDGVTIYRTDNNGNIILSISADGSMDWEFDNPDMSKNLYNGDIMIELQSQSEEVNMSNIYNEENNMSDFINLLSIVIDKKEELLVA